MTFITFTDEETEVQGNYVPGLPLHSSEGELMEEN